MPYLAESRARATEQFQHPRSVHRGLARRHPHHEMRVGERRVLAHRVVQRDEVVGRDVVAVAVVHLAGEPPALFFLAEPEQVARQLGLGGQVGRIEPERLPLAGGTFREPVLLGQLEADEVVDARVVGPMPECLGARRGFGGGIVAEVREHRAIGPRVRMPRVDRLDVVQQLCGPRVVLGVDPVVGQQQQARHVLPIDAQRGFQRLHQHGALAVDVGAGHAEMEVRVVGMFLQAFREGPAREVGVVFVEGELAAGEIGLGPRRVGLARRFENLVEDHLGIGPEAKRGTGEDDEAAGIAKATALARDDAADLVEVFAGAFGVAAGQAGLAPEPTQAKAARIAPDGIGEGCPRVGISPHGEEALAQHEGPFLGAGIGCHRLGGGVDGFGVIARAQQAACFRRVGGMERGDGEDEKESEPCEPRGRDDGPKRLPNPGGRADPDRVERGRSHRCNPWLRTRGTQADGREK